MVVDKENCEGESCSAEPGNILFILGGRRGGDTKKIYSFSLKESVDVPECQRRHDGEFPLALNYPSMTVFPEPCSESGFPTVCGGGSWPYGPWPLGVTTFKDCYKLNLDATSPTWEVAGSKNFETYATGMLTPQHHELSHNTDQSIIFRLILSTWLGSGRNWWLECAPGVTRCC